MPEMITAMAKRADGTLLGRLRGGINFFDPKEGKLNRRVDAGKPTSRSTAATTALPMRAAASGWER